MKSKSASHIEYLVINPTTMCYGKNITLSPAVQERRRGIIYKPSTLCYGKNVSYHVSGGMIDNPASQIHCGVIDRNHIDERIV